MHIRAYADAGLDTLRLAHASQGFDYQFPDLCDPIFVSKLVLEDDARRVVMASLARLTCELYLLLDRDAEKISAAGNPRERYTRLLALRRAGEQDLLARGLDDAHEWLPPLIARRLGRRLTALGWFRDDASTPYCFRLRANQGNSPPHIEVRRHTQLIFCRARPNWNASQIYCPVVQFHSETFLQPSK